MSVKIDTNVDKVFRQIAKLETKLQNEPVLESRKRLKAIARATIPFLKTQTPVKTGKMRDSLKVKSSTRRGMTKVIVIWDVFYAYILNVMEAGDYFHSQKRLGKGKKGRSLRKVEFSDEVSKRKGYGVKAIGVSKGKHHNFKQKAFAKIKPQVQKDGDSAIVDSFNDFFKKNGIAVK